jgi:hypothetical protein
MLRCPLVLHPSSAFVLQLTACDLMEVIALATHDIPNPKNHLLSD